MAIDYVGDNGPDGVVMGLDSAKKVGFYGKTPVVQRSSTVLATSLLSASSYVSVASNTAAILTEISNVIAGVGLMRTTA